MPGITEQKPQKSTTKHAESIVERLGESNLQFRGRSPLPFPTYGCGDCINWPCPSIVHVSEHFTCPSEFFVAAGTGVRISEDLPYTLYTWIHVYMYMCIHWTVVLGVGKAALMCKEKFHSFASRLCMQVSLPYFRLLVSIGPYVGNGVASQASTEPHSFTRHRFC